MTRSQLVLSDTHLSKDYGDGCAAALTQLLRAHPEARVVFVGDIVDLSLEPLGTPVEAALAQALTPHPELCAELSARLNRGVELDWVVGNHDSGLASQEGKQALARVLQLSSDESLTLSPWFSRRGGVHFEHGHLYDRDCAVFHPLAEPNPRTEGLGTALMRRFVAPNDALIFAHAHSTTPTSGLATAFAKWGAKAPLIIYRYFETAFTLLFESTKNQSERNQEESEGNARLDAFAASQALSPAVVQQMLLAAPAPTHENFSSLFYRLYFDRIFASLALAAGSALLGYHGLKSDFSTESLLTSGQFSPGASGGLLLATVGAGYLAQSLLKSASRYHEGPVEKVRHAAEMVRRTTDAKWVIFGHTHVEEENDHYLNLGSFGFGRRGRPYALVDHNGKPSRAYV